ncbi:MAG: hypothetical protein US49_C0005G0088 [candidate division TM6 bacterium GW2011_GWF2_37_49]|nr:MAG: hypothetical protein US49_C0005G0088 [candidate division TM6 bacterium GW2011_GWF2_37_49]
MNVYSNRSSRIFFKASTFCKYLIFFALLLCFKAFCMEAEREFEALAQLYFSNIPGISTVCNSKNSGHIFELEAAFCLPRYLPGQNVEGFSLFFDFFGTKTVLPFKKGFITPESVDYDIVSTNYVIECKHSLVQTSMHLEQFEKERKMLIFFTWLHKKISNGKIKIESFLTKKGKCLFKLIAKKQTIVFSCSWIGSQRHDEALKKFISIISFLKGKHLKIFIKQPVSKEVGDVLTANGYDYFFDSLNLFSDGVQTKPSV